MRNFPFLSEIVRAVLPSLWTVGFHCDTLLRYGSAIYKLPWPEGDCFNPQCFTPTPTMWHEDFANFSWVCQPSSASENCPVGSPSEILLRLQGFCICSSGHKEHIESNALVFHAKRCLQAVLEKTIGSVVEDALWFARCYFMRSHSSIYFNIKGGLSSLMFQLFSWKAKCTFLIHWGG